MSKCSQYFAALIDVVYSGDTSALAFGQTSRPSSREGAKTTLGLRIGELERRESTWGSAYWGVRRLAEYLHKVDPGMSKHSDPRTVVSSLMSVIDELAAARIELRELRKTSGLVCHAADKCQIVVK